MGNDEQFADDARAKSDAPSSAADAAVTAFFVRYSAGRDFALYQRERKGVLALQAYVHYRKAGLPVPEHILEVFDRWAAAMQRATTEHAVAEAVEMANVARKPALASARAAEASRDVMEHLNIREHELGQAPMVAARAVAKDFRLDVGHVKTIKSRWKAAGSGQRQTTKALASTAGLDLQALFTKDRLRQRRK